jgi:hypothetical protein
MTPLLLLGRDKHLKKEELKIEDCWPRWFFQSAENPYLMWITHQAVTCQILFFETVVVKRCGCEEVGLVGKFWRGDRTPFRSVYYTGKPSERACDVWQSGTGSSFLACNWGEILQLGNWRPVTKVEGTFTTQLSHQHLNDHKYQLVIPPNLTSSLLLYLLLSVSGLSNFIVAIWKRVRITILKP